MSSTCPLLVDKTVSLGSSSPRPHPKRRHRLRSRGGTAADMMCCGAGTAAPLPQSTVTVNLKVDIVL